MAAGRLIWDDTGAHLFETGVDRGVYYSLVNNNGTYEYTNGENWNGLTSVDENPSGGDPNDIYADNIKYLSLRGAEDFGFTIGCYTYPDGFKDANGETALANGLFGGQQTRKTFGFSYRTLVGNDTDGTDYGYKIHIVYGCTTSPSSANRQTTNENPEATEMSFECKTTPIEVKDHPEFKKLAHIYIDSTKIDSAKLTALEDILYGKDADATAETPATVARLPMPKEIIDLINANSTQASNPPAEGETPASGETPAEPAG